MALSRLVINHFRNLQAVDLELNHGFNFIVGNNGSGKTSLLEAIYYLGHGRSFKSAVSQRIIHYYQPHFTLFADIHQANTHWSVGLQKYRQGQTHVKINGEDGNKIADLAQLLPIQMISPEGLSLLSDGPSFRRAFLDWGLFHQHHHFFALWNRLRRLLRQRNAALLQAKCYADLSVWDNELIPLALQISQWRENYAQTLANNITQTCQLFLPELTIQQRFYYGWDNTHDFADVLKSGFIRDKQLGYTFAGPQKADLRLKVNGIPLDDVLSRGQLKLMMCALRLAQGEHLMQSKQRHCIFLLDDFASELDQNKRELLAQRLQACQSQVFISAIHLNQLQQMPITQSAVFTIENGNISQLR
ncbi:DNA replication/repair protein RecF [Spirabiliibacterium falconis]|uniref:DNA replication/repair protein RecF n=1 Tax=Spirabiliibacterium falconis TaxID=572023 RepID=UPI001AAC989F|nr:DNA replication/repair protein RecF [Spirabiliibacterium falconis]MBE2893892.1 DNA replication/repair protein RecF [Spirabiliibacterium falconis]